MWKSIALGLGVALGLAALVVWAANARFNRQTDTLIETLLASGDCEQELVTEEDLIGLPSPVQQWLQRSGIVGQPMPRTIRLQQEGDIRLGPDKAWMPFRAEQYYTINPTAFAWRVSALAAPGFFIRGVDSLVNDSGHMVMKPLGLFAVVDAAGPTLDQGTALRYLQEIVWFPFAALSPAIQWQPIDARTAQATLTLETLSVSGTFFFDESGHVVNFQAMRYRDDALDLWSTPMRAHQIFGSILVPTEGEGVWGEGSAAFDYIHVRITELEYDQPEVF